MPDTDIDKLREQGQTSAYMDPDAAFDEANEAARIEDALATAQRWEGRASALDKALSAAVAELVGLRTEVDQLRGDNDELRENVVHMESERTGKCLACGEDWTCDGYYADMAHETRIENLITAERDALQAEVERLRRAAEFWDRLVQMVVARPEWRNLNAWNEAFDIIVAALGVDPQKGVGDADKR